MREFLKSWFSFRGRIGRGRYLILTLLYSLVWVLGSVVLITLAVLNDHPPDDATTNGTIVGFVLSSVVAAILAFVFVLGLASTGVRRLHDRGKSGYWLLFYYLLPSMLSRNAGLDPVGLILCFAAAGISIWVIVDLGFLRGEAGSNAFGPNPSSNSPEPAPAN